MSTEVRPVTPDEFPEFARTMFAAAGLSLSAVELEERRLVTELDRTLAVIDDGRIVATIGAHSVTVTLPGGRGLPAQGLGQGGVSPTHRRRGVGSQLMLRQFADARGRGEALVVSTASESLLHARFGYGPATWQARLEIERHHAAFTEALDDTGRIREVADGTGAAVASAVHAEAAASRPGEISRQDTYWQVLEGRSARPHGELSPAFWAAHENADGRIDGVVAYRFRDLWRNELPDGEVHVELMLGATPAVEASLWRHLFTLDLARVVIAPSRPVGEPLRHRLHDPRRLWTSHVIDHVWARLLDVERVLSTRAYGCEARMVFEVKDHILDDVSGAYVLESAGGEAICERTAEAPDIMLGISELSAVAFGGVRLATLAAAGRVTARDARSLVTADAMLFATPEPFSTVSV